MERSGLISERGGGGGDSLVRTEESERKMEEMSEQTPRRYGRALEGRAARSSLPVAR